MASPQLQAYYNAVAQDDEFYERWRRRRRRIAAGESVTPTPRTLTPSDELMLVRPGFTDEEGTVRSSTDQEERVRRQSTIAPDGAEGVYAGVVGLLDPVEEGELTISGLLAGRPRRTV